MLGDILMQLIELGFGKSRTKLQFAPEIVSGLML